MGCRLTAIEYGTRFSELCKEKFTGYPKFSIITGKFEDIDSREDVYDLVFSATAFHWIPEELGYPKVYSILKKAACLHNSLTIPTLTVTIRLSTKKWIESMKCIITHFEARKKNL